MKLFYFNIKRNNDVKQTVKNLDFIYLFNPYVTILTFP